MTKKSQGLIPIIVLLLGATSLFLMAQHHLYVTRDALLALTKQQMAVDAQSHPLEQPIADAKGKLGSTQRKQQTGAGHGVAASHRRAATILNLLIDDPQMQARYFAAKRANLASIYGPFYRELNLSPDQIGKLESILMERDERTLDVISAVPSVDRNYWQSQDPLALNPLIILPPTSSETSSDDDGAAGQFLQGQKQSFQDAAVALLGADGFQQLDRYERSFPMREVANELTAQLAATATPLDIDKANQLTQLLAEASPRFQQGGRAFPVIDRIDWTEAMEQARPVLSAPQFATLATITAEISSENEMATTVSKAIQPKVP